MIRRLATDAQGCDSVNRRDEDHDADVVQCFLDDLFHGCAFAAFVEQAMEQGGPPDSELTRRRAYRYYERELAVKNSRVPAVRGEG